MSEFYDTIAAISTPPGEGGIAVIRVSGADALHIIKKIFLPFNRQNFIWRPNRAVVGDFLDDPDGEVIDQVVMNYFRAPKSYTGEDVLEISCHGGRYLSGLILQSILRQGARVAQPGEFTKRAYLNERMDLAQAEAVAQLIHAKTRESIRYAIRQLKGGLSEKLERIRGALIGLLASLELELDFSEEDVELVSKEDLIREIKIQSGMIRKLIQTYQTGRFVHEGMRVTLVGKPNVGKSTLFNVLIGSEKAIVDEIPGTTRDALEAQLDIKGRLFRLVDTAGLRRGARRVEKKGISITEKNLADSDVILFVLDGGTGYTEEDERIRRKIETITETRDDGQIPDVVALWNKSDLDLKKNGNGKISLWRTLDISAKSGAGIEDLFRHLGSYQTRDMGGDGREDEIVTSLRHRSALSASEGSLERAIHGLESRMSNEFIAADIREALSHFGEIVGGTSSDDVLNYIFDKFCIGK